MTALHDLTLRLSMPWVTTLRPERTDSGHLVRVVTDPEGLEPLDELLADGLIAADGLVSSGARRAASEGDDLPFLDALLQAEMFCVTAERTLRDMRIPVPPLLTQRHGEYVGLLRSRGVGSWPPVPVAPAVRKDVERDSRNRVVLVIERRPRPSL